MNEYLHRHAHAFCMHLNVPTTCALKKKEFLVWERVKTLLSKVKPGIHPMLHFRNQLHPLQPA